jgi:hypothetical protein
MLSQMLMCGRRIPECEGSSLNRDLEGIIRAQKAPGPYGPSSAISSGVMFNSLLFIALLVLVPCLRAAPRSLEQRHNNGTFVPFHKFIERVKYAKFEDYKHTNVESRHAFKEMKNHVLDMYHDVGHVTSFVLNSQYADCIAIEKQPSVRKLCITNIERPRFTPDNMPLNTTAKGHVEFVESPLMLGLTDPFGNQVRCRNGTIPMSRLTLEKLTSFRTLKEFFEMPTAVQGNGVAKRQWDPNVHYAAGRQSVNNFGGEAFLNLWNPVAEYSLSQMWFEGGAVRQRIHAILAVLPQRYHSTDARLSIYWTAGDSPGLPQCWDLDCPGFVHTNMNWWIGGPFTSTSTTDGPQVGVDAAWAKDILGGPWHLWLRSTRGWEDVGYYPSEIFNGGQMSREATSMTFGGQEARVLGHAWGQMGSGEFASAGFRRAAFQTDIIYYEPPSFTTVPPTLTPFVTSSSCYTFENTPGLLGTTGTAFFFGGPGGATC